MVRAFLTAPSGVAALVVLGFILFGAIVAPQTLTDQATELNMGSANVQPSAAHLLGTDTLGRDIVARILVATRLSIGLAFAAALIGAFLGMTMGVGAVVLQGRARSFALRAIDALIAFPSILIALYVGGIMGPGMLGVVVGVGVASSFSYARVTSALSLGIVNRDFISAARIAGIGPLRLMTRHMLPNIAETLAITTTVAISNSITSVSTLSFLGLGVQPPSFDWGRMLTEGVQSFYVTPAAALGPAFAIAVTAMAFGFSGEAIARALNPILWARREEADTPVPEKTTIAALAPPSASGQSPLAERNTDQAGETALEVTDLSVSFPARRGTFRVVDGVSFSLGKGERIGIVGESGCGKTTTALALAQLVPYPGTVEGSVKLQGRELMSGNGYDRALEKHLGTSLAVVYQDPLSSLNPALKIGPQMTEASEVHLGISRRLAAKTAADRLREVNIPAAESQLGRYPHELSGGMRQRVMIAMGLMMNPALFICDEPTTSLDVTVQAQIVDVLAKLNADHGSAIILISHNLALVSQNTDRVLVMYAGRIVEDLTAEQLLKGGKHPYTRQLLASIPDTSRPREKRLEFIAGQAPDPAALPPGCPYSVRCPIAFNRCRVERPPLRTHPEMRRVACWAVDPDADAPNERAARAEGA
jgi:peptide/nickel transport system ATP-binding protein/peptide/nickel transport system permease protein